MKDFGLMTKDQEEDMKGIQTQTYMMENSSLEKLMVREHIFGILLESIMRENGKKDFDMVMVDGRT